MTAKDALADSLWMGAVASESPAEEKDLKGTFRVFARPFLDEMHEGDIRGLLVATMLYRNGKQLSAAMILVLRDRVLLGWMKGLLKKPTVESIPLSAITDVQRSSETPARLDKVKEVIKFNAADDQWLAACSPSVSPDAPLYKMLVELLNGEQTADKLPAPPASEQGTGEPREA
jgi:hypothetical protein